MEEAHVEKNEGSRLSLLEVYYLVKKSLTADAV
jgi:hypothetical protein